jgi:DNA-binding transcriptional ArsR family regulator
MSDRISRATDGTRAKSGGRRTIDRDAVSSSPPEPDARTDKAAESDWEAVRSPTRLQILEAIATSPGIRARDIAEAMGTSAPRLHYHLKILTKVGLVRVVAGAADDSEDRGFGAGFEIARPPRLRDSDRMESADRARLKSLVVGLGFEGMTAAAEAAGKRSGDAGGISFARCGHEALAPHEIEAVLGHLQGIEGILARASERRRRTQVVSRATVFLSYGLGPVHSSTLPDGMPGWGAPGRIAGGNGDGMVEVGVETEDGDELEDEAKADRSARGGTQGGATANGDGRARRKRKGRS